jgi:1-aminocyclopropane-1-carboxylate deaminase/D-cysteine desulfhydrase-like pyridoxal-dependent ACC family enzyme
MSGSKPVVTPAELRARLDALPRLSLADLPTPLLECPRLSEALGGPRILVKREDLTGLAFGGNKVREFEYSLAPAVRDGYDVLLHGAASQSNQSRLTAAAAARLGLKAVMVGKKDAHADQTSGNLLLVNLFGAEVHLVDGEAEKNAVVERLRSEGRRVYNTSTDGAPLRSVAYVDGFLELWEQLGARGIRPDAIYVCSGAHTHVGLVVGARALGVDVRIVGISPSPRDDAEANARLAGIADQNAGILGLDMTFAARDIESYSEYAGESYGVVTPGAREAVRLAARTEGLVLDPVYTAKTLDALRDHIRKGWFTKDRTVVFVHTGGTPALFAYGDELLNG